MPYVKWVANVNRHTDWATRLLLEDGKEILMGVPVDLSAADQKQLEGEGRIFEDSSADEAKEVSAQRASTPQVGGDVAGSAPTFENAGASNQTDQAPAPKSEKNDK